MMTDEERETFDRLTWTIAHHEGELARLHGKLLQTGDELKDAVTLLQTVYRRQGATPQMVQEIEQFLRRVGFGIRRG